MEFGVWKNSIYACENNQRVAVAGTVDNNFGMISNFESKHRKLQHKQQINWSTLRATYDHFKGHCSKCSVLYLKVRSYAFEDLVIILILLSVIIFQLTLITLNNTIIKNKTLFELYFLNAKILFHLLLLWRIKSFWIYLNVDTSSCRELHVLFHLLNAMERSQIDCQSITFISNNRTNTMYGYKLC